MVFIHTGGVGSLAGAGLLTEVDLSSNKLTGALPALPAAIQMANMSGNAFAGGIPTSYGVRLSERAPQHALKTCLRLPNGHACGWAAAAAFAKQHFLAELLPYLAPWRAALHRPPLLVTYLERGLRR